MNSGPRPEEARSLSRALSAVTGVAVTVSYQQPGSDTKPHWQVSWTAGPSIEEVKRSAELCAPGGLLRELYWIRHDAPAAPSDDQRIGLLDVPPPESWPRYDQREAIETFDTVLTGHRFDRHPPPLVTVPTDPAAPPPPSSSRADPPVWTPDRLVMAWLRWREYSDGYERALRGEESYTADAVSVWGNGVVDFDVLGHRATFDRWPASWTLVVLAAVLEHLAEDTGPETTASDS